MNFEIYAFIIVLVLAFVASALKILREYQRGVVFFLGRFQRVKGPGMMMINPGPLAPMTLPKRNTIPRSYSLSTRIAVARKNTSRTTAEMAVIMTTSLSLARQC